jgi:hypothetical protein
MPFMKLQFKPGINREITSYSNEGGWRDCDKVRFQKGFPEQIGGWQKHSNSTFLGTCRALLPWISLAGDKFIGVGTHLKYYISSGGNFNDITPIRATDSLTGPFSATNGSATLTVTQVNHGAVVNDFVTFSGATGLGGNVTADVLNAEHQITAINSTSEYEVTLSVTANASDTGNGGSVTAAYQINTGLDTTVVGTGWGTDTWGSGGWGSASSVAAITGTLRLWSHDNFGEDLIINVRDGGIYYWDKSSGLASRAVPLSSLAGASNPPTIAKQVLVSDQDGHVIAFGCDSQFDPGVQDPMLIRFSSQLDASDWDVTSTTNTAGDLPLSSGSEIICAIETRQQILVFTNTTLYGMQFLGPPYIFGINPLTENVTIASPNAAVAVQDRVYWMGQSEFYMYTGAVQKVPCMVRDYVFDDIDQLQFEKVFAGLNSEHSEIWWFYPSTAGGGFVDKYVIYNYEENTWAYGTLARTAWFDRGIFDQPIAAGTDNYLYEHEVGINDGSQNPTVGINSYIESSPIDIGDGDEFMFISRMIPDVSFMQSTETVPQVDFTVSIRNFPDGTYNDAATETFVKTQAAPITDRTEQLFFRLRGRQMRIKVSSNTRNVQWRLGTPRVDARTDGRR